jgi:hypothetical protein
VGYKLTGIVRGKLSQYSSGSRAKYIGSPDASETSVFETQLFRSGRNFEVSFLFFVAHAGLSLELTAIKHSELAA